MLQARQFARQRFELAEWHFADLSGFKRDHIARMLLAADGVDAEQFARQMEAGNLHTAVGSDFAGLGTAGTDCEQRLERIADPVEKITFTELAVILDGTFERAHVVNVQAEGQAQIPQ